MSVFRIITRIIPLNSSESTFQPASFESLTDGNVGNIIIRSLKDPESGMNFRVEMIKHHHNVRPGETVDSINADFAKRLEDIPGFVELKANDIPFNPYDKSIQITLPEVLSGRNLNKSSMGKMPQENNSSKSLKISVVKNDNFNNSTQKEKGKKLNDDQYEFKNKKSRRFSTENIQENNGRQSDPNFFKDFNTKYNYNLAQKTRNSAPGIKNKLSPTKQRKASPSEQKSAAEAHDRNIENEEKTDTSLDLFDYGDLVARALIPEDTLQGAHNVFGRDSFHSLNINTPEYSDDDESSKYSSYPLSKLLMSLKKYYVDGECLICGFIPTESDFNPSEHLKTHISSHSFLFRFRCFCCDEGFVSPKDLYKHALSRDKSYNYVCTMCNLNFKRRHYLMRHNANSWKNHI